VPEYSAHWGLNPWPAALVPLVCGSARWLPESCSRILLKPVPGSSAFWSSMTVVSVPRRMGGSRPQLGVPELRLMGDWAQGIQAPGPKGS
jgi:hypothetical protein